MNEGEEVIRFLMAVVCLVLMGLGLGACSHPEDEGRARLHGVDVKKLRWEAAVLYKQLQAGPGPEFAALKPKDWPVTFQKLQPVRVGCYRDGFAFALEGDSGRERGLHIQPTGMDKMPRAAHARYERLEEGVYWYETSK